MRTKMKVCTLVLSASVAFFTGCKDEEVINGPVVIEESARAGYMTNEGILIPSTATLVDVKSARIEATEFDEFAKLLAGSLKNEEMRTFIKDEASKQFDGDYDILVSNVLDSEIGGETFSEIVQNSADRSNARTYDAFNEATDNPKLNIAVPMLIESWNHETQQPLVAVAIGAVEGETKFLKAFDSNGTEYLLDAEVEPDVPVIVIANNERMGMVEEVQKGQDNTNAKTSGRKQMVTWLKCPNLSDIESWYFGGPEIRFDGVAYSVNSQTTFQAFTKTRTPSRDQAKDGYTFSQDLFRWYFDGTNPSHGPNYYIQSWEIDDSGTTYKLSVSVTAGKKDVISGTAGFEISYTAQDKKLPGQLINYNDPITETISDSYLQFKMTEGI